ncbi:3-dehydroquinate synthase [Chloroflexota bacterium]
MSTLNNQQTHSKPQGPIFLYGPSGSGKSTVGMILAESLDTAFVDLDLEIETQSGMGIPEIFSNEGESGFREREYQALQKVLTSQKKVIALGGGALTVPRNREIADKNGRVILLKGSPETLLSRLQNDSIERPLLNGDPVRNLRSLLEKRQEHYDSFPLRIETDEKSLAKVVWEIQIALGIYHLKGMESRKHPAYDVCVQPGSLDALGEMLQVRGLRGPVAVVTDENVGVRYLSRVTTSLKNAGYDTHSISIPPGEEHKTLETVTRIWEAFASAKIERSSTIVALGGGVAGDLAGFAAASWLRSVPWVVVPTSLLAMVDASMGGKTGFDLPQGKNLIGAFHPPRLVLADPNVLGTLPEVELINGMAEVAKHGVVADPALFELCGNLTDLEDISSLVSRAMAVKVKIIEDDPYEKGFRAALNLGHTVGHGVELTSGFQLRHGEAVAIGMVAEARMAEQIGLAEAGLTDNIAKVLQTIGLPTEIPPDLDRSKIVTAMTRDKKKAGGVVKFALPEAIGNVKVGIEIEDWRLMIGE